MKNSRREGNKSSDEGQRKAVKSQEDGEGEPAERTDSVTSQQVWSYSLQGTDKMTVFDEE